MKKIRKTLSMMLMFIFVANVTGGNINAKSVNLSNNHSFVQITPNWNLKKPSDSDNIDLSLEFESSQSRNVLDTFNIGMKSFKVTNNKNNVKQFIPEGSICTDVSAIGDVVYIDYRMNGIRYLTAYYSDGTVEKVARAINGDDIYSVNNANNKVEHLNVNDNKVVYEISDTEATQRINEMKKTNSCVDSYLAVDRLTRGSGKTVYALKYTDNSSTAPYKAKVVQSGTVTIDAFSETDYSTSQRYRVYETMSYHTQIKKESQKFAIGVTVTKIATIMLVPASAIKIWLTAASVAFSSANILEESCQIVDEHAYKYLGGKEFGIYDPTSCKSYVEAYSTWDYGKISLGWDYDSSTGYRSPRWVHTARSDSLKTSNNTIRDEGKDIYNNNIVAYDLWKWGKGNGFGY